MEHPGDSGKGEIGGGCDGGASGKGENGGGPEGGARGMLDGGAIEGGGGDETQWDVAEHAAQDATQPGWLHGSLM